MAIIPTTLEAPPDSTSHNVARPLFGRTVASLENGVNYHAGFKGLRRTCAIADFTGIDNPPTGGMTYTLRLRHVVSPLGRYINWGALVAAQEYDLTIVPSVKVWLYTPAGVLIDGPVEWTAQNGRLPTSFFYNAAPNGYAASLGRESIIHTGWPTSASGTTPRQLDADGYQGLDVEIRVVVNRVRVYSHWALETYRDAI